MEKASLKHKQGIIQPQTFAGKEFKGASFTATPAQPCFKDFSPGQSYKQRITMTNVFYGRCTFKVMPMPDEVADVFAVEYTPPGHISAGMTCDLLLTFKPRVNQDIETVLPLLSERGPILVPIQCLTKKAAVTVSENVIDFGSPVTIGDSRIRQLTLSNLGAMMVCTDHGYA
jgi:hypothetical protein